MKYKCKFCGAEVHREKYLHVNENDITCGICTSYCMKKCDLVKNGTARSWYEEPCLSCDQNPYYKYNKRHLIKKEKTK